MASGGSWSGCDYLNLSRPDKGLVRHFAAKITGLSRAQITRLIPAVRLDREARTAAAGPVNRFRRRYTAADIAIVLAELAKPSAGLQRSCPKTFHCSGNTSL